MTDVEDTLTEGEKDEMEKAAIKNERSKTKYGSEISDGHREDSE